MSTKYVSKDKMAKWTAGVGGKTKATLLIVGALNCSLSKAEKIASGRYPCGLSTSEQVTLSKLTKFRLAELFPEVSPSGEKAS